MITNALVILKNNGINLINIGSLVLHMASASKYLLRDLLK